MTTWSKAFTIRSNARRAARSDGANPNSVRACPGGYQYDLAKAAAAKAPAVRKPKAPAPVEAAKPAVAPAATEQRSGAGRSAKPARKRNGKNPGAAGAAAPTVTKPGSNLATVLAMISKPGGATVPELTKATGWKPHTLRARISGLAAEHKLAIMRERLLGVTTYSVASPAAKAA